MGTGVPRRASIFQRSLSVSVLSGELARSFNEGLKTHMGNCLDFIIGGMPRGGTTLAGKFFSLHPDIFCYSQETHVLPFLSNHFNGFPCNKNQVDCILGELRSQMRAVLIDMPLFSVLKGAHPGNILFQDGDVDAAVESIKQVLLAGLCGQELYIETLRVLRELIQPRVPRQYIGEKTPENLFAMAEYGGCSNTLKIVVVREPAGVIKSMHKRANNSEDVYASAFRGELETNLGMYIDYADAAARCLKDDGAVLIRYEDLALDPAGTVKGMFDCFGKSVDGRVRDFVEGKYDREIADRAPMNYRRLKVTNDLGGLSELDYWKVVKITEASRELIGYGARQMAGFGYPSVGDWPGLDVPCVVLPMSGFHEMEQHGRWMKKTGLLIAYLVPSSGTVEIELRSNFPQLPPDRANNTLRVEVNGNVVEELGITKGQSHYKVVIPVADRYVTPMGKRGGFMLIRLRSGVSYSPMALLEGGKDTRQLSFLLTRAEVK